MTGTGGEPQAGSRTQLSTVRETSVTAALCGGWFLVGANLTLVPPLLSFVSRDLGLSTTVQGILVAALPLGSFLGNVIFGPLVDAVGPRRAFVAGASGAGLALLATAALSNPPVIIALRILAGLLMPLVGVSIFSCVAEYIRPSRRVTVIGYVTASGSLANLSTVPAVVLIAGLGSWRWAFLAVATLAVVVSVGGITMMPSGATARTEQLRLSLLKLPKSPGVRAWVAIFFLFTFAQLSIMTMYPTWLLANLSAVGVGIDQVSLLFLAGGSVMVLAAVMSGPISRRTGPAVFVALLGVPALVALALPAVPDEYGAQLVLYALLMGAQALTFPLIRASANSLGADELSSTNASLNAGFQIASTTAGLVAAFLYSAGPSLWINAGVASVVFVSALTVFMRTAYRTSERV